MLFGLSILFLLTGFGLVAAIALGLVKSEPGTQSDPVKLALTFLPFLAGAAIYFVPYWFLLRPMMRAEIRVLDDRISIQLGKKTREIPYADIVKITWKLKRWAGGWFTLSMNSGKKHRFTVVLERSEYLIEGIRQARADILTREQFEKLRLDLVLIDHGFARMYARMRGKGSWILTQFVLLAIFVGTWVVYRAQKGDLVVHALDSYLLRTVVLLSVAAFVVRMSSVSATGAIVGTRLRKRLTAAVPDKRRDIAFERKVGLIAIPVELAAFASLVFVVCAYDLNAVGRYTPAGPFTHFNLQAFDPLWVDARYNCLGCRYPIEKGDVVLIQAPWGNWPAGVVGLPGERLSVNRKNAKGFFLATAGEEEVLPGQVAVQLLASGKYVTSIIGVAQVDGLLSSSMPFLGRPAAVKFPPAVAEVPPKHGPALLQGCDPGLVAELKASTTELLSRSSGKLADGTCTDCATTYAAAAGQLGARAAACPGVTAALTEGLGKATKYKADDDRAWTLQLALEEIRDVSSEQLAMAAELSRAPASLASPGPSAAPSSVPSASPKP